MAGNTFDAGSISATLTLERSDFNRELRAARTDAEKFEKKTFKPKVSLDRTEFTRELGTMRAELASLRDVRLNIGVAGSTGQIQQIRQQLSTLRGAELGVRVNGIAEATAQLSTLRQHVNALDGRTINIHANFDGAAALAQIAALRAALAGLDGQTTRTTTNLHALRGSGDLATAAMGALMASAVLAAPALIPLSAAALNVSGSFAAMTTSVGVGLGLFTLATVGAVKRVSDLDKQVDAAKKNLNQQREALGRLTPGTDAYGKQLGKVAEAQKALNTAQAAYTPQQKAFSSAMDGMKSAWQGFVDATSSTTLPIASTFVRTVAIALPKAVPAVRAMAPEVKAIADDVQRWTKDGGFDRLIQNVIKFGVPAFRDLRRAGKDVLSVLGTGFRAFLPQSVSLAASLRQGAASLRAWADGGGFQRFLAYVRQNAPQVKEFFHTLGAALKNVFNAMSGLGPLGLGFVTLLLKIVAALPVPVLQGMILAWTAWKFAILGVALAARAMLIFNAVRTAILGVRSAMLLLSIAFGVTPIGWLVIAIGLLVAAVVAIGLKTGWLQKAWKVAWDGIKTAALWVWNNALKPAFAAMSASLRTVGGWAKWLWSNAIKPSWNAIKAGTSWLYHTAVKPPLNLIIGAFKQVGKWAKWLWNNGIKPFWNTIKDKTGDLKNKMIEAFTKMKDGIGTVWGGIKSITAKPIKFVVQTVYNDGIRKIWNGIASKVGLGGKASLPEAKLGGLSKYAYGGAGPVKGGLAGIDSVNARLMPDEHVWTADEVRNAGGHGAVAALRAAFSSTGKARLAPGSGSVAPGRYGSGTRFDKGGGFLGTGIGPDIGPDLVPDGILKKGANWLGDKLKDIVRGAIGPIANPLLDSVIKGAKGGINSIIPGAPAWQDLVGGVVTKPVQWLKDWLNADDAAHAGGANVAKALDWAKGEAGKPYIWGGVGPKGYDCSGFMSAIQNVIDGNSPYTRRWATPAFPPGAKGWKRDLKAPFTVGITNKGVGHTAGTLAGVNVESRGGKGVVVGSGARGTKDRLFTSQWGYKPSAGGAGSGRWSETVTAVLRELGQYNPTNLANVLKAIQKESGGNPNAVNNWDSNAKAGNPSKGLLQVILSTFNAYAGKYKSKGQLDPYANIYAAVRYARSRYGAGWSARMARPGGYAMGGVTTPGLHMMGEKGPELVATGDNSRVFTAQETQRMLNGARGAGGGVLTGSLELTGPVTLTVDGEQFDAHLDGRARATVATMIHEAEGSR
ncbi:transglycosylase SLT domain-containing protein [Streptomyces olivaceus]|uniref:transglycosylase SLT domain-containing protein n=1 Tax=Streptomyces olivaceus TaxID=47716 RepID=UPI0037FF130A